MDVDYSAPMQGTASFVTSADGARIHCVSAGSGQPIVLAHGFAIDKNEWNVIAADLVSRGHQVIAFDQRGHGLSTVGRGGIGSLPMSQDYAAVLREHDVRDGVLVAHSMGGFLAIRFLLDNPDLVSEHLRSVLLVATFAGDVNRDNPQNRLQIPLLKSGILGRMVRSDRMGRQFANTLIGDDPQPAMADGFLAMFRSQQLRPLVPILEAMVRENRYDRLGELDLPCSIIVGSRDRTTPPFHTDELHAGIRGSSLRRVEGSGHMINWEASDVLVEEILALAG